MGARLLADENVPGLAVAALRHAGHDVVWMLEGAPGTADVEILARAQRDQRVLVTFDKDFGELAFRLGAAEPQGWHDTTGAGPASATENAPDAGS